MTYGKRTIPALIDDIARETPDSVWASYPACQTSFQRGEFRNITYSQLSKGINRLSWHLKSRFGGEGCLRTICYIGPSDVRYFFLAVAASKCGFKTLFTSPRNNLDAHLFLIDQTDCRIILGDRDRTICSILDQRELQNEQIPSIDDLLAEGPVDDFPWTQTFDQVAHEPFLVLHTSGSTGLPKPVEISHGLMATIDAQHLLEDVDGRSVTARKYARKAVYTALPPFHSAGINFFGFSVFHGTHLIFGPCEKPPSVETVEHMLTLKVAQAGVMAPSLLTEVAADPQTASKFSAWDSVTFGGGPLSQEVGDSLWQYTTVLKILGSTETFNLPELTPKHIDEWQYHAFHPHLGIEFRPNSDTLSELVFVRDKSRLSSQGAFWHQPEATEYSMKDLYEEHPSKPGLWKYQGRLDDIIVLSNGEKFNPCEAERKLAADAQVQAALIVGEGKNQSAVLIEPAKESKLALEESSSEEKLELVKGIIETANSELPGHAQIHETHVKVLDASNAFLKSTKGGVQRTLTTKKLEGEIAGLYEDTQTTLLALDFSNNPALLKTLTLEVSKLIKVESLGPDDDFFSHGMDSLIALRLSRGIKATLKEVSDEATSAVSLKTIYRFSTTSKLATALMNLITDGEIPSDDGHEISMQQMNESFRKRISAMSANKASPKPIEDITVILTGSTGSLGSYLLDVLLTDSAISRVICLNRSGSTEDRQKRIQTQRGLSTHFLDVEFLEADLTKENLGLESDVYKMLLEDATHIIHNAWPVNFNLPLSAFEKQLEGCYGLIELSRASAHRATMVFMSSVGAANNWLKNHEGPVPEVLLPDFDVSESMGYAQSKQLAELMFGYAAETIGTKAMICRVGQIAGPVKSEKGIWNPNEWFPSLLLGSMARGKVPETLGAMDRLDWIPVDLLADVVKNLVFSKTDKTTDSTGSSSPTASSTSLASTDTEPSSVDSEDSFSLKIRHLVNPNAAQWKHLVHDVSFTSDEISIVPFKEWIRDLRSLEDSDQCENKAIKLLDFYMDIGQDEAKRPIFATEKAQSDSSELASLQKVSVDWIQSWISQWNSQDD